MSPDAGARRATAPWRRAGGGCLPSNDRPFATDDDQRAVARENAAKPGERTIATDVEDDVVAPAVVADVGVRVVDDVIGSHRSHEVQLLRARVRLSRVLRGPWRSARRRCRPLPMRR